MVNVGVKYIEKENGYGVFEVEPLERGFGTTIGNSIRRVLLSSLEGAAVTSVQIEGVNHEFGTVEGVKEDVLDILMNIKELVIKSHSETDKQVVISKKGPGDITAADIEHDDEIEIINKKKHIATLNKSGKLTMKLNISTGKGYVPSELQEGKKGPIDMIYLDASYSPVLKVNHTVEPTRVGKLIDFDKLILEVWTNGSVSPEDAVKKSSVILQSQLSVFDKANDEAVVEVAANETKEVNDDRLSMSVDELNISSRTSNSLKRAAIMTIGELVEKPVEELMGIRNFGTKALVELNDKLKEYDLALKGDVEAIINNEEE